jgi:hypothetical protein
MVRQRLQKETQLLSNCRSIQLTITICPQKKRLALLRRRKNFRKKKKKNLNKMS